MALTAVIFSAVVALTMVAGARTGFEFDFKGDLYGAGRSIAHGASPYNLKSIEDEAAIVRAGGTFRPTATPRWPAPILVAAVPFSFLPVDVAAWLFMVVSAAGLVVALRLLGVTDWRCLGAACLSWPAMSGLWLGNLSPLLVVGAALAWRYRSHVRTLAAAVACVIVAKVVMWPLTVWLLVTKRFRALGLSLLTAACTLLVAWAAIGFAGFTEYPHMLSLLTYIGEGRGSSLVTILLSGGMQIAAARALAVCCAGALLYAAAKLAPLPDGDRRAFGLCVMAVLIATPVLWPHYLVLLFVPIALLSPQLSALWFLPMLAVVNPLPHPHPSVLANLPDLAIELVVIAHLCSPLLRVGVRAPERLLGPARSSTRS